MIDRKCRETCDNEDCAECYPPPECYLCGGILPRKLIALENFGTDYVDRVFCSDCGEEGESMCALPGCREGTRHGRPTVRSMVESRPEFAFCADHGRDKED